MEITTITVPVSIREAGRRDLDFIESKEKGFEVPFNVRENLYYNGSWFMAYIIESKVGEQLVKLGYIIVHAIKNDMDILEFYIERIFIIPEFRNQGLATHGLKAAFIKMTELDYKKIKVNNTAEVKNSPFLKLILIDLGFDLENEVYFLKRESI